MALEMWPRLDSVIQTTNFRPVCTQGTRGPQGSEWSDAGLSTEVVSPADPTDNEGKGNRILGSISDPQRVGTGHPKRVFNGSS